MKKYKNAKCARIYKDKNHAVKFHNVADKHSIKA